MGRKTYKGPVHTLQEAMWAGMVVVIHCQSCDHKKRIYAYRLASDHPKLTEERLFVPLPGFFCRSCRRSTEVVIRPAGLWD